MPTTGFANIGIGFDLFNPKVSEFIRTATYNFVESTLATAAGDAMKAYADLRGTLGAGLAGGETTGELNARVYQIFRDPYRAARVGQSEAARSVAGGGYMLAEENGVQTVRWLSSHDCCDLCAKLNGQERTMGEPFLILPKAKPPYNVVYHAPAHPHCQCTEQYLLDDARNVDEGTVQRLRIAAYDPSEIKQRFPRGERLAASLGRYA